MNLAKIYEHLYDCFLCLSVNFEIEHLWETAYFIYKLPNFNHHISKMLFEYFIQEEEVAI